MFHHPLSYRRFSLVEDKSLDRRSLSRSSCNAGAHVALRTHLATATTDGRWVHTTANRRTNKKIQQKERKEVRTLVVPNVRTAHPRLCVQCNGLANTINVCRCLCCVRSKRYAYTTRARRPSCSTHAGAPSVGHQHCRTVRAQHSTHHTHATEQTNTPSTQRRRRCKPGYNKHRPPACKHEHKRAIN